MYMSNNQQHVSTVVDKLFRHKTDNYIFVYTPPKVGSTTLVSSLRLSLGNEFSVIHIHDEVMLQVLTGITNVSINDIINHLSTTGKKVYVIDVYRTPVERKMSEFFEKVSPLHFNNSENHINTYSIKRIVERFNKLFPHLENGDHYIDKYDIPLPAEFDFEKKYLIHLRENTTYIKLRLCDSGLWGNILSTIFGKDVVVVTDYESSQKVIGTLYAKFKMEYRLPVNFVEILENCKYLRFYYSENERKEYIQKWTIHVDEYFAPFTNDEYNFYIKLCLENQHINDIQADHYIDNGCSCVLCSAKRRVQFQTAKNGGKVERIIHTELVQERNQKFSNKIVKINKQLNVKKKSKFVPRQFNINLC